jgi:hypothetical protein
MAHASDAASALVTDEARDYEAAWKDLYHQAFGIGGLMEQRDEARAEVNPVIRANERLVAERDELLGQVERLKGLVSQAFDAMSNRHLVSGPQRYTRYPCECGRMVSNSGIAAASHRRGTIHRQNMERRALGLDPV